MQATGEYVIPSKVLQAQRGDISAQKFLQRLDPTYNPQKEYSTAEIQELASRNANIIHGTGDIRSLPGWMLKDSELSGFFSLAHWSVAQTNNFMKEVYEPATRGDIKPLMVGLFGSAIGGYLIQQLRQDISGKKNPIPSLQEIAASDKGIEGNKPLIAYNMIAALQYAGFTVSPFIGSVFNAFGGTSLYWQYSLPAYILSLLSLYSILLLLLVFKDFEVKETETTKIEFCALMEDSESVKLTKLRNERNIQFSNMSGKGYVPVLKGGKKHKKGGTSLLSNMRYGLGSAYNSLNGFRAPVNPLPYEQPKLLAK
jgi:hypothetical protein